jgi:glycosyltransferase involved in cell wall biosynthesis
MTAFMISVVIPALNEEKFIPDCLRSLKSQDYQGDCEIIVADNGSTDNTARISRDFGAKVVYCPEKKDVFYARLAGADATSGDIIAQADADTVYPANWLRRIADRFASHPEAVAVAGRYIYRNPPWWAAYEYFLRLCINRLTIAFVGRPLLISGSTFVFRRGAFLAVNGYRGLSYSVDQYGISDRLSKQGKILYDKDLCVSTSSRRVSIPLTIILIKGFINFINWIAYYCKKWSNTLRGFTAKAPAYKSETSQ